MIHLRSAMRRALEKQGLLGDTDLVELSSIYFKLHTGSHKYRIVGYSQKSQRVVYEMDSPRGEMTQRLDTDVYVLGMTLRRTLRPDTPFVVIEVGFSS